MSHHIALLLLISIWTAKAQYFVPVPENPEFPLNFSGSYNSQCRKHSDLLVSNLRNGTLWAYRMWDASAKTAFGLTEGKTYELGNFDECMDISEPFTTQYCLATIHLKIIINHTIDDPFSLQYKPYQSVYDKLYYTNDPSKIPRDRIHWGLCVPAFCSTNDVETALQKYLDTVKNSHIESYDVEINSKNCQIRETTLDLSIADICFCMVIICLILIVTICTIFDYNYNNDTNSGSNKSSKCLRLLYCFSARKNFLDLEKPDCPNNALMVLYFFRVFLTWCTLITHTHLTIFHGAVSNVQDHEKYSRSLPYMLQGRFDIAIDSFLLLSGLLTTYSYLAQSQKRSINPFMAIILRYFRLVPSFAMVTFFYVTIFNKLGSGPLWNEIVGKEKEYCEINWWANLLLINNYINVDKMCILQGWYMAVDFQLILLSIPLNNLIKENSKYCWSIFIFILSAFIVIPFLVSYLGNKEPILYIFYNCLSILRSLDFFRIMYIPSYTRASPFIIGMVLGYIYYKMRKSNFKLSVVSTTILLIVGNTIAAACIFTAIFFYQTDYKPSLLVGALYTTIYRPLFAIATGLIVFTTSYGTIPIFGHFIRWSAFIPLSKLSFGVFMWHMAFQLGKVGSQKISKPFTVLEWMTNAVFDLVVSHLLALILYLLLEMPLYNLMKELLSQVMCSKKTTNNSNNESIDVIIKKKDL